MGIYVDSNNDRVQNSGDTIAYTIVVNNNSSVALHDITITGKENDTGAPLNAGSCTAATVPPHSSTYCTANYTLLLADLDRGAVAVTATVTAVLPGQSTVSVAGTTTMPLTDMPKLTVDNSVSSVGDNNNNGLTDAGDVINYRVQVTNSGNSTVSGITATESVAGAVVSMVRLNCDLASVVPGAAAVCTGSYTITSSDVDTQSATVTATARVSGTSRAGRGRTVIGTADTSTRLTQVPELSARLAPGTLSDTNGDGRTDSGDTIAYTAVVSNTGTVTLSGVGVTLALAVPAGPAPTLDCSPATPATLAPGSRLTCNGAYTLTQSDVDKGEVVATANATAKSGTTTVSADPSTVTTSLQQNSGITAVGSVAGWST